MAEENEEGRALPAGAVIVKVGAKYRLIWNLGGDLGYAWYNADGQTLRDVFGKKWQDDVFQEFKTVKAFENRFGDNFWGHVKEIDLTADDPWQDLTGSIFQSFGPVAGLQTAEIKRLVLQGYFEGWSQGEFIAHYQQTNYFHDKNDLQRTWATLSQAERNALTTKKAGELLSVYRSYYGVDPPGGLTALFNAGRRIASGVLDIDTWAFKQRKAAEKQQGSPAQRALEAERKEQRQGEVDRENIASQITDLWREWVGPGKMPAGFANTWANGIYMNTQSMADLEKRLKSISKGRWGFKDPEVTWEAWAAPWKGDIENLLEIGAVDDDDKVLNEILSKGLTGIEARQAIKSDKRWQQTSNALSEIASATHEVGRMFGFVSE